MKILILADPSSIHTIRWANSLYECGLEIAIFGFAGHNPSDYSNTIRVYSNNSSSKIISKGNGSIRKFAYVKALTKLKKLISEFKPDILHAHYASSYGVLGAFSKFHPFIVSVWGSDIYIFPKKSIFHRRLINFVLERSNRILSTSITMSEQIKRYTKKQILITPFGVDIYKFYPQKVESIFNKDDFIIGSFKGLYAKYGNEYLIKAFKLLKERRPGISLKLLIAGSGILDNSLKKLAKKLDISDSTIFTGNIPHNEISKYYNMIDVFVAVSIVEESFGVAVIEASACEKPVVVSNMGGLPEVVLNNRTGLIVPPRDEKKLADAIEILIDNNPLRSKMGKAGRQRVQDLYDWNKNVKYMINIYHQTLDNID